MKTRVCEICGKTYLSKINISRYCSELCRAVATEIKRINKLSPRTKPCEICNKVCLSKPKQSPYCSDECREIGLEMKRRNRLSTSENHPHFIVFNRDNFTCIYCGKNSMEDNIKLELDHVIPISKGGKDTVNNLVTACTQCNRAKCGKMLDDKIFIKIFLIISERNKSLSKSDVDIVQNKVIHRSIQRKK